MCPKVRLFAEFFKIVVGEKVVDFACAHFFVFRHMCTRIILLFGFDRSTGQQHYIGYVVWKGCGENFFKGCPVSFRVI